MIMFNMTFKCGFGLKTWIRSVGIGLVCLLLSSCTLLGIGAEQRIFLTVNLSLLDTYEIPPQIFENTRFGGISALTYDRQADRIYALSDEHSSGIAPHFYTLRLDQTPETDPPQLETIALESVTFFTTPDGEIWDSQRFDPEGLALTPQGTLWLASEGIQAKDIPPALVEFDRETGRQLQELTVPNGFKVTIDPNTRRQQQGVQSNLGFESLTLSPIKTIPGEPLRLFTVNEAPLLQDLDLSVAEEGGRLRLLHYDLTPGNPLLLSEHLYPLETVPLAVLNGLSELLTLDGTGHFLTLERSLTPFGFQIQLFQAAIAGATDISGIPALKGDLPNVNRVQKQLVLNVNTLDIPIRNLEGMTWGPQLADGSQTILLVSDNNFEAEPTQFLWFRLEVSP